VKLHVRAGKQIENRALRGISVTRRQEATAGLRKVYNEDLHNMHSVPDIIRRTKSRRMTWAELVARMGKIMYEDFLRKC
jgi:hypothetical protein